MLYRIIQGLYIGDEIACEYQKQIGANMVVMSDTNHPFIGHGYTKIVLNINDKSDININNDTICVKIKNILQYIHRELVNHKKVILCNNNIQIMPILCILYLTLYTNYTIRLKGFPTFDQKLQKKYYYVMLYINKLSLDCFENINKEFIIFYIIKNCQFRPKPVPFVSQV